MTMSDRANIFDDLKIFWPVASLFACTVLALLASLIEGTLSTKLPKEASGYLVTFIPIDSIGIRDVGRLTNDRDGNPFSALNLNGKDNFVLMDSSIATLPDTFSISYWISVADTGTVQTIFQKGEHCSDKEPPHSYQVSIAPNGRLFMKIFDVSGGFAQFQVRESLLPGNWNHVVMSLSADRKFECYINGNVVEITSSYEGVQHLEAIAATRSVLKIGGEENFCGGLHYFTQLLKGTVDEIYIFKKPLNATEVTQLYEPASKKYLKYKIFFLSISGLFLVITLLKFLSARRGLEARF